MYCLSGSGSSRFPYCDSIKKANVLPSIYCVRDAVVMSQSQWLNPCIHQLSTLSRQNFNFPLLHKQAPGTADAINMKFARLIVAPPYWPCLIKTRVGHHFEPLTSLSRITGLQRTWGRRLLCSISYQCLRGAKALQLKTLRRKILLIMWLSLTNSWQNKACRVMSRTGHSPELSPNLGLDGNLQTGSGIQRSLGIVGVRSWKAHTQYKVMCPTALP